MGNSTGLKPLLCFQSNFNFSNHITDALLPILIHMPVPAADPTSCPPKSYHT